MKGRAVIWKTKNRHLLVSALVLLLVAGCYGIAPGRVLPLFFDFTVKSPDLNAVFRAVMGLYLGNIALWIMGVLRPVYWKTATISNVVLMSGLAFGRLVSLVVDGWPSPAIQIGLAAEICLAGWGGMNLKKI